MRLASQIQSDVQKEADATLAQMEQLLQNAITSFGGAPMAEMACLLSYLKAEVEVHQSHHWRTRGSDYYGDHLLFQRLYEDSSDLVDGLAERTVGSGQQVLVQPLIQGSLMLDALKTLYGDVPVDPDASVYPILSLRAVLRFLVFLKLVYGILEQKGQLSLGIDNLLQGIADKHEEFVYLLKQRAKTFQAANPRSIAWKVENKQIRLTPKELERASNGYTIIVRPQPDGTYLVAPVKISGSGGDILEDRAEIANDQQSIPKAVKEVNRWLDKLGFPVPMADASRSRWKA